MSIEATVAHLSYCGDPSQLLLRSCSSFPVEQHKRIIVKEANSLLSVYSLLFYPISLSSAPFPTSHPSTIFFLFPSLPNSLTRLIPFLLTEPCRPIQLAWMDQDETWQAGRPRRWPYRVRYGQRLCLVLSTNLALYKFLFVFCIFDGDPAPLPPKEHSRPQFSTHICSGQRAGWIKMPLGMEAGLGLGDFVLDGDPSTLPKNGAAPIFSPHQLWPNG